MTQHATYTVRPGLTVSVEAQTQVALFEELSSAAEVFGEPCCGLCSSKAIYPVFRHVGKYQYAEWACPECGARLSMGQTMEGDRLFPIRALTPEGKPDRENGRRGSHHGWTKYRGPDRNGDGPQTPRPAAAPPTKAEPPATITQGQWETIQAELRKHLIGDRAFLDRFGYKSPRLIPAHHFGGLIDAARKPDDRLRAAQKAGVR